MSNLLNKKFVLSGIGLMLIVAIVAFTSQFSSSQPKILVGHMDHFEYENVGELEEAVDMILIGYPVKEFSELEPVIIYNENGRYEDYLTPTEVKIKKVVKGDYSDDTIFVTQRAAFDKKANTIIYSEDWSPLEKDKEYLLFLSKITPTEELFTMEGRKLTFTLPSWMRTIKELDTMYSIHSINQGQFNIDSTDYNEKTMAEKNTQYNKLRESVYAKYKEHYAGSIH